MPLYAIYFDIDQMDGGRMVAVGSVRSHFPQFISDTQTDASAPDANTSCHDMKHVAPLLATAAAATAAAAASPTQYDRWQQLLADLQHIPGQAPPQIVEIHVPQIQHVEKFAEVTQIQTVEKVARVPVHQTHEVKKTGPLFAHPMFSQRAAAVRQEGPREREIKDGGGPFGILAY